MRIAFEAPLWEYAGKGAWHFLTLPADESAVIRLAAPRRGWGSVRVRAAIGGSAWATSIFWDSKTRAYLLPVKAEIRRAEGLAAGQPIAIELSLDL